MFNYSVVLYKNLQSLKRKGDEPVVDATQEKIAKLKEVAAEKLEEALPSEPANEAEAVAPEATA